LLVLKNIVKEYETAGESVAALKGVDIAFRKREFVSILGHSGCGKTTLLNVVGGLDRYTSGDLIIRGKSTKEYSESDWDAYRNHSVGFVFQSYNLIPHQTVLSNVELALTLSGVSKAERRSRAVAVLEKVGLGDQIHKKPNQMSGGQMQRVAIARALINDPEILLADEPTGALDTDTSFQIMELLKEISGDRLIIMVTHNPELAEQYSDRIIRLKDGEIVGDTNPFSLEEEQAELDAIANETPSEAEASKKGKTSMSFFTALTLSLNNLMTKKGRTFMTAFAGSIGIIGIALILSLSNGIQTLIDKVQKDTLSSYPIQIESETMDMAGLMSSLMGANEDKKNREDGKIYSSTVLYDLMTTINNSAITTNNLEKFKLYLDSEGCAIRDYSSHIQYGYDIAINAYLKNEGGEFFKADVSALFSGMSEDYSNYASFMNMSGSFASFSVWQEMLDGEEEGQLVSPIITSQYDLLEGKWPESYDEIVLLITPNNEVSDITLYSLGLISTEEMIETMIAAMKATGDIKHEAAVYEYSDIIGKTYNVIASTEYFKKKADGLWYDISTDPDRKNDFNSVVSNGASLKIVGVIRQKPDVTSAALSGSLIYTKALTDYLLNIIENSDIVKEQKANEDIDVFTGLPFVLKDEDKLADAMKPEAFKQYVNSLPVDKKAELFVNILTTPTEEYVKTTSADMLASYGVTKDMEYNDMLNIIVQFAGETEEDKALIEMYLSTFTKDELYAYLVDAFGTFVRDQFSENAKLTVNQIENTPSKDELEAENAVICFSLLDANEKKRYFANLEQLFTAGGIDEAFIQMIHGIVVESETMTDVQLIARFAQLARLAVNQEGIVSYLGIPISFMLNREDRTNFILGVYSSTTTIPVETIMAYLSSLDDIAVKSVFDGIVSEQGAKNYANVTAPSQTAEMKNSKLAAAFDAYLAGCDNETLIYNYNEYMELVSKSSLKENYTKIGFADKDNPNRIVIYANDFESKETISDLIKEYNESVNEDDRISYTDYVALLMSSVTTIINAISYVLIAFVSISLVVSSIMIGIITYISVLERTKEIGILRSIGASRRDISRVFNAETLIVGFVAGAIGIITTLILNVPINIIIEYLSELSNVAILPWAGGVALVIISMALTFIAGLIPSGLAAKKDPVVALRSE